MKRMLSWTASIFALAWAANAAAQSLPFLPLPPFQVAYAFTGSAECLVAPGSGTKPSPGNTTPFANAGFNSALQPITPAQSFANSFAVEGIRIFRPDGTGTVTGTSVSIAPRPTPGPTGYPSFPPDASAEKFTYNFTYTITGLGTWSTKMVPGSYVGTFVTGPRSSDNETITIDAIPPFNGFISVDAGTLTAAHTLTAVETATFSNGDVWPRICHRSRVLIRTLAN